jgi:energy-coupling factor transporter ATP-binding protein EcfA2
MDRLNSIRFKNYKSFKSFSLTVKEFNVLVGPNNSGKSTILGAIRLLAEALRKARSRKPELLRFNGKTVRGYHINFQGLPVSTENVFTNYDDSQPAEIAFRLASGNSLTLGFETAESCCLIPEASDRVRTVSDFKNQFDFSITSVPVLGPVDANEPLYEKEAARLALLTHGASRNFRNIWYHYPGQFE